MTNEEKEQLIEELIESNKDTVIAEISFRITKDEDGEFRMVELYDTNIGILHGNGHQDPLLYIILDATEDYYFFPDELKKVGWYECKALLKRESDSDGSGAWWDWLALDYISVTAFTSIERMVHAEIEYDTFTELEPMIDGNSLPF